MSTPLTLNVDATRVDSDRRLRDKYDVNSPKNSDRRGKGTPVGPDAQNEERDRAQYGINSPRAADRKARSKDQRTMTERAGDDGNPLAAMMTQVDRPDKPASPEPEVQTIEPMGTEDGSDGGYVQPQKQSCWSMCFSCCLPSTPSSPPQQQSQTTSRPNQAAKATPKVHPVPEVSPVNKPAPIAEKEAGAGGGDQHEPDNKDAKGDSDSEDLDMPGVKVLDKKTADPPAEEDSSDTEPDPEGYLGPNVTGHKRCLVLDLDETLVHSSFKAPSMGDPTPDFIVPVTIDGVVHKVYVLKRPYADEFLIECAKHWEVVIFTASLSKYADPLLDMLDKERVIVGRLFREHCVMYNGAYVKDLTKVGRKLKNQVFIDNAPKSYLFQPNNAVPITSWFDDKNDTELLDCLPVLNTTLLQVPDVRDVLDANNKSFRWLCRQATEDVRPS